MLRSLFSWLVILLFSALIAVVLVPLVVLSLGRLRAPLVAVFQPLWARLAAATAGLELEVVGREHLDGRRARVCMANHASTLDMVAWAAVNVPDPVPVVKRELMWVPPLNVLFWLMGGVFVQRGSKRGVDSIRRLGSVVRDGKRSVQMSVEGTRSKDGRLQPFKKGPFHLAWQADADIVPVVIIGAHTLCPPGRLRIRPGRLRVVVKPPRRPTGDAAADALALHAEFARWLREPP